MSVRLWVIITLAAILAAGYVTFMRIRQARDDRWLIEHGVLVQAKVLTGNGSPVPKRWLRDVEIPAKVEITLPGRQPMQMDILVAPREGAYLQVGGEFPMRVHPDDPTRWTDQAETRPWSTELIVPLMLIPLVVVLALMMLLKRRAALQVWREGTLTEGVVVETRHTAMAPGARIVRFSLADGEDPRIFGLLLPTTAGIPQPGEKLWLLVPMNDPKRAIAAAPYVQESSASPTT